MVRVLTSAARFSVQRFGAYEFDPRNGELRKQGIRIRLEGQPLAILRILLERRGELLTREELQKNLWPAGTFVDFDHSLNAAIKRLRKVLNDSAVTPRYIETVASRGYRFIAPVERLEAPDSDAEPAALPTPVMSHKSKGIWLAVTLSVLAAVLLAMIGGLRNLVLRRGEVPPIHSLAVLPLENLSGDPSQEYFSDGMTDALITDLAQISDFRVISRTSVMHYKDAKTRKPLPQIARELGVDGIVEGTVVRAGSRIRITSQLIYAPSDQHLWARSYERGVGDFIELQGEVAQAIAGEVLKAVNSNQRKYPIAHEATNPAAYDAYLKGRHYWNQRTSAGIRKSIESFQEAIRKDPNFGPAYAGLADAYNFSNILGVLSPKDSFPEAKAAAIKALELDPDLAEAHAALGMVKSHYEFDFPGAQKEFVKAIELNPNYANAHLFYSGGYFTAMGQHANAIAEMKEALELDPLSAGLNNYMGMAYLLAGDYVESRRQFERTIALDPTFPLTHFFLARLFEATGEYEASISARENGESLSGASPEETASRAAEFRKVFRAGGPQAYWRLHLALTLEDYKRSKGQYFPAIEVAAAYAKAGDKENAFKWLEKSFQDREGQSITLVSWLPDFRNLHGDKRFQDLLRRVGLPE
jgi:TolB-like protein/DNA-binding winged helix-turn-helix (wHTH) protein